MNDLRRPQRGSDPANPTPVEPQEPPHDVPVYPEHDQSPDHSAGTDDTNEQAAGEKTGVVFDENREAR